MSSLSLVRSKVCRSPPSTIGRPSSPPSAGPRRTTSPVADGGLAHPRIAGVTRRASCNAISFTHHGLSSSNVGASYGCELVASLFKHCKSREADPHWRYLSTHPLRHRPSKKITVTRWLHLWKRRVILAILRKWRRGQFYCLPRRQLSLGLRASAAGERYREPEATPYPGSKRASRVASPGGA
jgi:hypothetical protein